MKIIFKITVIILALFSSKNNAQKSSNGLKLDTLNYLKQFEANKANYIGQPFSKLLNDMTQIQPKSIWSSPNFKNKNIVFNSTFNFCNIDYSFHNVITLSITWQNPIPNNEAIYYENLNHFYFTNDERN